MADGKKAKKAAKGETKKKTARAAEKLDKLRGKVADLKDKLAAAETKLAEAEGRGPAVSPFAVPFPDLPPVAGVRFAAAAAGVKYQGRRDVMLAEIAPDSAVAGVFTRSSTRAAPVDWCRERLKTAAAQRGKPLGIVVNSGNANAFTGKAGMKGVVATARAAAKALKTSPEAIYISSTGVIGEALPADRIAAKLKDMAAALDPGAAQAAAEAIMTTDTFPKGAYRQIDLDGVTVTIAGFAKGSGMIAPDMATMLGYVFTDAPVARPLLQSMLRRVTETTFNAATVDSDTSTSDTVLLFATGKAGGPRLTRRADPRTEAFETALAEVMTDLAQAIVKDGEGASKFVKVRITGAKSDNSARIIARAVANSPLVKTAIAGEDPNWGRIVMAVGKSGQPADRDRLTIRLGDILVADKGWVADSYSEDLGAAYMKAPEIEITADLALGAGEAEVWTCDLTHGYVTINADYRS